MPKPKRRSNAAAGRVAIALTVTILVPFGVWGLWLYNNQIPEIDVPTHPVPADNGLDDFIRAGKLANAMQHPSPLDMPPEYETSAAYAASANDASPVLDSIRSGISKPCVRPPVRSIKQVTANWAVREAARAVAGVAEFQDQVGRPGAATTLRLDGVEMGVDVMHDGGLIDGYVGVAVEAMALHSFERDIPKLTAAELRSVGDRLRRIELEAPPFLDLIQEDQYQRTAMLMEQVRSPDGIGSWEAAHALVMGREDSDSFPRKVAQHERAVEFMVANKRRMIADDQAFATRMINQARKPFGMERFEKAPDNPLAIYFTPYVEARPKFVGMEAVLRVLRTEVACYRYRAGRGRFPDSLNDLVPAMLPSVPLDPCAGAAAPLKYRSINGGTSFLLYSIGPNRTDDGGTPGRNFGSQGGDIVAGNVYGSAMVGKRK